MKSTQAHATPTVSDHVKMAVFVIVQFVLKPFSLFGTAGYVSVVAENEECLQTVNGIQSDGTFAIDAMVKTLYVAFACETALWIWGMGRLFSAMFRSRKGAPDPEVQGRCSQIYLNFLQLVRLSQYRIHSPRCCTMDRFIQFSSAAVSVVVFVQALLIAEMAGTFTPLLFVFMSCAAVTYSYALGYEIARALQSLCCCLKSSRAKFESSSNDAVALQTLASDDVLSRSTGPDNTQALKAELHDARSTSEIQMNLEKRWFFRVLYVLGFCLWLGLSLFALSGAFQFGGLAYSNDHGSWIRGSVSFTNIRCSSSAGAGDFVDFGTPSSADNLTPFMATVRRCDVRPTQPTVVVTCPALDIGRQRFSSRHVHSIQKLQAGHGNERSEATVRRFLFRAVVRRNSVRNPTGSLQRVRINSAGHIAQHNQRRTVSSV